MIDQDKCGLNHLTQQKLIHVFQKYEGIEKVILYGSRAKGNYKPGSDIDLTLVAPRLNLSDLLKIANEIDDLLLPYKVDLSLLNQVENPALIEHIQRVGIVFYEHN